VSPDEHDTVESAPESLGQHGREGLSEDYLVREDGTVQFVTDGDLSQNTGDGRRSACDGDICNHRYYSR